MKYTSHLKQLSVDMFRSSFDKLDKNNRWVKLGDLLPWTELEKVYNSKLDNEVKGAGNKPARMIIGACIIKHKFSLSDEDTISMIQENPYMQYLCGLSEFTDKPLFDYTFIDHHSWDAYNESTDLSLQIQLFKERFGYLPATILADKIYMNHANRRILKEYEIKTYCKPLGRPPKEPRSPEYLKKMARAVGERNEVECSFGTGKRVYRANNIRAKLPETAECWTGMCYFVKNVMKFLRELCLAFFEIKLNLWANAIAKFRVRCFAVMAIY